MSDNYDYKASTKSSLSDELINTYLLRPIAGLLVRVLYFTPVTPNQVTLASVAAGLTAAFMYWQGALPAAGILVTCKDLLDSADGQLARAKNRYSRRGRFLDSIGDFLVDAAVFAAIGALLYRKTEDPLMLVWAFVAFAGITLRVSYHVFYQASSLHLEGQYRQNRITEEITDEDRRGNATTLLLHRIFLVIYGWQDRLMARIDRWCRDDRSDEPFRQQWYSDEHALRMSGFLGFGTELFLLTVFSLLNALEIYLIVNIVLMNGILLACIAYRRRVVRRRLSAAGSSSSDGSA